MSALARWFKANDYFVSGYDSTRTALTDALSAEGIQIHFDDDPEKIAPEVLNDKKGSLIIYTPAIPKDHKELNHLKDHAYEMYKRSEVLGFLTNSMFTIAVAGTHGKTTTSSMIAHILKASGLNCTAFVGGIMTNYASNLIIGNEGHDAIMVVEADEFDRSFLTLHPDIAVITAVDADHLDIYGTADELKDSFKAFIKNIKKNGQLFIEEEAAKKIDLLPNTELNIKTYGVSRGQIHAENLSPQSGKFLFDYYSDHNEFKELSLKLPGFHNVSNATAAIATSEVLSLEGLAIKKGIDSYRGVKRRFEYIIHTDDLIFIDDYAHHPVEIAALLNSVNSMFTDKRITAIFQPHLYTRTRDFAAGFAKSLSQVDEVILLDIYPAREKPLAGVTSEMIYKDISVENKQMCSKSELLEMLSKKRLEVLLTIGAGDIDKMVEPIKAMLNNQL